MSYYAWAVDSGAICLQQGMASEEFRPGSPPTPLEGLRNGKRSRRSELEGVHWGEKKALAGPSVRVDDGQAAET